MKKLFPDEAVHREVVFRAMSHVGKLFDSAFDFRQAERSACTALVYRSWHGIAGMHFKLGGQAGRFCLPAGICGEKMLKCRT